MNKGKLLAVIGLAALIAAFFIFDLGKYFGLDYIKSQQAAVQGMRMRVTNTVQIGLVLAL